jgi:HK97 gp10 family phage protein
MINVNINDKGFTKTAKLLEEGAGDILSNVITRVATFMERTAKLNIRQSVYSSPRGLYNRTGKARQSIIRGVVSDTQQRVYMGVNYGIYLEKGTGIYNGRKPFYTTFGGLLDNPIKYKGMKARPFWKPAVDETRKNVSRIIKEETSKL